MTESTIFFFHIIHTTGWYYEIHLHRMFSKYIVIQNATLMSKSHVLQLLSKWTFFCHKQRFEYGLNMCNGYAQRFAILLST